MANRCSKRLDRSLYYGPDRAALTHAANTIDRMLGQDPFANSESHADKYSRIMIVDPLAVSYDVSEDDRLVTVWAVWKIKK